MKEISQPIIAWMQKLGVSRTQLATRLGCTPAYVSKMLNGQGSWTMKSATKICAALGLRFEFTITDAPQCDYIPESEESST